MELITNVNINSKASPHSGWLLCILVFFHLFTFELFCVHWMLDALPVYLWKNVSEEFTVNQHNLCENTIPQYCCARFCYQLLTIAVDFYCCYQMLPWTLCCFCCKLLLLQLQIAYNCSCPLRIIAVVAVAHCEGFVVRGWVLKCGESWYCGGVTSCSMIRS